MRRNVLAWLREVFNRLCLSPLFATAVTLLIILAGGMGSIWSDEIRNAFPFVGPPYGNWSPHAVIFWMSAILASVSFFFRQAAADKEQAKAQTETVKRARELASLIRTLPPANFLGIFSQLYNNATKAVETVFGTPKGRADVLTTEKAVRSMLRFLAILVQQFDGGGPKVRYAANVMIFRDSAKLSTAAKDSLSKRMRFADESVSIDNLKGVLELMPNLSVVIDDTDIQPDKEIGNIVLPIPKTGLYEGKSLVLPGAPKAFADKEPLTYPSTGQLAEWCKQKGDFTERVRQQVAGYFENAKLIGSFVSFPLFPNDDLGEDDKSKDPFAIVNVHCDRENILRTGNDENGRDPVSQFFDVIRPMQVLLAQVILALPEVAVPEATGEPMESEKLGEKALGTDCA